MICRGTNTQVNWIISRTGADIIDPIISLVIAAVILFNTVRVVVEALRTLLSHNPSSRA